MVCGFSNWNLNQYLPLWILQLRLQKKMQGKTTQGKTMQGKETQDKPSIPNPTLRSSSWWKISKKTCLCPGFNMKFNIPIAQLRLLNPYIYGSSKNWNLVLSGVSHLQCIHTLKHLWRLCVHYDLDWTIVTIPYWISLLSLPDSKYGYTSINSVSALDVVTSLNSSVHDVMRRRWWVDGCALDCVDATCSSIPCSWGMA